MRTKISKYTWLLLIIIAMLFLMAKHVYSMEISTAYCPDVWRKSWQSGGLKHDALEVELKQSIKEPFYGALSLRRLNATLTYPHDIDGKYFQGNETTLDFSVRLGIEHQLIGPIYSNLFGGLGYMFDHVQPEFGDSGILAHFGGMILIKGKHWKVGYGLAHYSDPTQHSDMGRNYQIFMVGILW